MQSTNVYQLPTAEDILVNCTFLEKNSIADAAAYISDLEAILQQLSNYLLTGGGSISGHLTVNGDITLGDPSADSVAASSSPNFNNRLAVNQEGFDFSLVIALG
jgi:hypothetical protein